MKKVLFIDRDGTIIHEPSEDFQIDSFEKLSFLPDVITSLRKIVEYSDYELVMVSNQDGLGTESFPEEKFWPPHNKMLEILESEGIRFKAIHIDPHFEHDNSPDRKPGTGMLNEYLSDAYDLENSYVIGDRFTDVKLAKNLKAKSILIGGKISEEADYCTENWKDIVDYLIFSNRKAIVKRETSETKVNIELDLDGTGLVEISTGLGFFDHMLEQIARHGSIDLRIKVAGDLHVDEHHTIEDTGLALGEALAKALGDKKGIQRYGFYLPMDEALASVAIDFGGRPWIEWEVEFKREKIGDVPTEMFYHFFKSFTDTAKCNLNIKAEGKNEHHIIEAVFKGFARSIKMAKSRSVEEIDSLPSTKGLL